MSLVNKNNILNFPDNSLLSGTPGIKINFSGKNYFVPVRPETSFNTNGQVGNIAHISEQSIKSGTLMVKLQAGDNVFALPILNLDEPLLPVEYCNYLFSWGDNSSGQLGLGDTNDRYEPEKIGSKTWQQVAAGYNHTLAIDSEGFLWGWGNNSSRQLGLGELVNYLTPQQVCSFAVKYIATGYDHSMLVDTNGDLWGCGNNTSGAVGISSPFVYVDTWTLVTEEKAAPFTQVACGNQSTFAIDAQNILYCCGSNSNGRLGMPESVTRLFSITPADFGKCKTVVCGDNRSFAVDLDNVLYATGSNQFYQLGLGEDDSDFYGFASVDSELRVQSIACTNSASYIIDVNERLWGCGLNSNGILGKPPSQIFIYTFNLISTEKYKKITAGHDFIAAISEREKI